MVFSKLSMNRRLKRIEQRMIAHGVYPAKVEHDITRDVIKVWEDKHHYMDFDPNNCSDDSIAAFMVWHMSGKGY